ncbi:MAG: thioredoxin fold domain-containing protein [Kangiellaceae bacterium]|nr:thioredoxin fold domain-containing protein [Kangiellaceae bacterium]
MKKIVVALATLLMTPLLFAGTTSLSPKQITQLLESKFPGASIQNVAIAEIDSLYYFMLEGDLYYISKDGNYLIKGQLLDISNEQIRNLSRERMAQLEKLKSPLRKAEIAKLAEKDMVIFKAPNEQHVITIFTDIDCGYCQKLHRERQEYLDQGITLRYIAFPRAGLKSPSAEKLEGIWCSTDRQQAMTDAKLNRKYSKERCETPFEEHMSLVRKFGLRGTPGIILENGDLIGGYLPAEVMRKQLDSLRVNQTASK